MDTQNRTNQDIVLERTRTFSLRIRNSTLHPIKLQTRQKKQIKGRLMGLEPTTYAATKHRSTIELQTP